jgi:hypothetical protein
MVSYQAHVAHFARVCHTPARDMNGDRQRTSLLP